MKKYYPELDAVSDFVEVIPYPQCKSIANAIRICNDQDTDIVEKLRAVVLALL